MAWRTIPHTCGHEERHNLIGPERDRPGKAKWLGERPCSACLAKARADERAQASAEAAEATQDMIALEGSPKQVAWATTIRAAARKAIDGAISGRGLNDQQQAALKALYGQDKASWWIDNQAEHRHEIEAGPARYWLTVAGKIVS